MLNPTLTGFEGSRKVHLELVRGFHSMDCFECQGRGGWMAGVGDDLEEVVCHECGGLGLDEEARALLGVPMEFIPPFEMLEDAA